MSGNGDGANGKDQKRRKKPRSPHYRGNNEGGYGNPPVNYQFPANNPGGPGRPRGANSVATAFRKVVRGKVPLADGNNVSFAEALALAARRAALSNGIKGVEFGLRLQERYGLQFEDKTKLDCSDFNDLEIELLFSLLSRATSAPADEPTPSPFGNTNPRLGPCTVARRPDGHLTIESVTNDPIP